MPNTQVANDLYESVKRKDIEGNSFGFKVRSDVWSKVELEGKEIMKRTLTDVKLIEISPTPFPAYSDTEVDCRSLEEFRNSSVNTEMEIRKQKLNIILKTL